MRAKMTYRGRITEIWSSEREFFMELMEQDRRLVFKSSEEGTFQIIRRGDIVEVEALEGDGVREIIGIERLSGPQGPWSPNADGVRWRWNLKGPSRMALLWQRQKILSTIREDLIRQQFLEVESPLLVKGACPDTEIKSVAAGEGYLVTSTEYQIKRMLVGGFEKLFTLTRNFRGGDRGKFHSSEFTMLEWARAYESLDSIEEDAVRFIRAAFAQLHPGKSYLIYNEHSVEILNQPWERLTVRDALKTYLGLEDLQDFSLKRLLRAADDAGVSLPSNFRQDQHLVLSYLIDQVQRYLGTQVPTFLREWPEFMTSSALINERDPFTSVRSELFIGGVEVANGFPFLMNPKSQREFFQREIERRRNEGKEHLILDDRYIAALEEGIPPGAGMALGVDRLVMVLTGAQTLSEVQAFSWDEL